MIISIDLETRSALDLRATGVYPYARHPTTAAWCAAYACDDEEPEVWRPGEPTPEVIVEHAAAGGLFKAWKADFERIVIRDCMSRRYGWPVIPIPQWRDTQAEALAMALPAALGDCAAVVGLAEQKDRGGRALMLQMARPRGFDGRGEPIWWDDAERVERLIEYCRQDVRTERALAGVLRRLSPSELAICHLTSAMNDSGVSLDMPVIEGAQAVVGEAMNRLNGRLRVVTRGAVDRASQIAKLMRWFEAEGLDIESLDKASVRGLLRQDTLSDDALAALEIRQEAARASTAKLSAFRQRADADGRIRGSLVYHAATTGRWSSVGAQLHNVPRETVSQPAIACARLAAGDTDGLELLYGPALATVSKTLRPMVVAAAGHELVVADYAAIEARGVAWLSGQDDLVEAFAGGADIYLDMAAKVFDRPVTRADAFERFIGKALTLGAGYQLGAEKFAVTCAKADVIVDEELAQRAIQTYRSTYSRIPATWRELQEAALASVRKPGQIVRACLDRVAFQVSGSFLACTLPSGRRLFYPRPHIRAITPPWDAGKPEEERGEPIESVMHYGLVGNHWQPMASYGGRWMENVVQAVARDLMKHALLLLSARGWRPVLTIHDEIVCEEPKGSRTAGELVSIMTELPEWAEGFPLSAEGWAGPRYSKGG